ncbi:putative uncharacterized protein DDB_G0282133 isoform X2 [Chrysoperla carnea]|uniref:putative uncharacterized protein DDB_G0282133 isoform X2 n=1 Tax=Chrysoperla carnea TaxID=189513 RepID=UPI001D07E224|nr:putative uncharacterized protein DDB_G0282133 isoform X2 [Chrysoperla carnea]
MQNSQYFYDGIDSYLYSLVHYSGTRSNNIGINPNNFGINPNNFGINPNNFGINPNNFGINPNNIGVNPNNNGTHPNNIGTRPNNAGNYQQPYRNTNNETQYHTNLNNRNNDYVRQNIAVNRYNNFNSYDNRYNNFENEQVLNNRYYNNQHFIPRVQQQHSRQRLENPYYNPNHWNRYPQNNNYARPQVQTQSHRGFQAPPRSRPNRQLSRVMPLENVQQIPGNNELMFDSPQKIVPLNPNNALFTENEANQRTDTQNQITETSDLFQIDTQADLSNLEKTRLDEDLPQPPESASADTNVVQPPESTSTDTNVVQGIISAFSNAPQENTQIQPDPDAIHEEPQTAFNVTSKEPQFNSNSMRKPNQKAKRNKNKKNKKDESKYYQNFISHLKEKDNVIKELPKEVANTIICLDSEPEDEDDDVIEIPRSPIPMICLEDSDAEIDQSVKKVKDLETPECPEIESNVEENKLDIPSIQKINTSSKEVGDNPTSTSKSKKRQKRKRENVETSENIEGIENQELQTSTAPEDDSNLEQNTTDIEINPTSKNKIRRKRKRENVDTSENIEGSEGQELQTSPISEDDSKLEQNTTDIETNRTSKRKKREKRKRENLKNVVNEIQNEADTSVNIGEDIQKLQASILQKVLNSVQNTSTSKNKKRQRKKRDCLENVENELKIEPRPDQSNTDIPMENISTSMKGVDISSKPSSKKRLKKKRHRQDIENSEDNESTIQENCETSKEIPKKLTMENTKEISVQSTPTKNIEFATPKSKKRNRARNKKKNTSQLSEGSDDFLLHTTDLESNQSTDSVCTNDTIISANISKKKITVPQTLILDIYETESSCSDVFEKDNPEQNQASTSKRSFAELDLIQFANMITTSRSKENQGSDSIVCAKSSQNCNQTTSVSFSADNSHRVIATDTSKFNFEDTSSSSDESEVVEKNKSQEKNSLQSTFKNSLESDLSYQKFLNERGEESSTEESEIITRIRNHLESDKSKNITKSSLSQINDKSKFQNSLVPLNNAEQGDTTIDVNYEQFINQLENKIRECNDKQKYSLNKRKKLAQEKIRKDTDNNSNNNREVANEPLAPSNSENSENLCTENSETLCTENSETVCNSSNNFNEITQELSQSSSDNDSDVECITPITSKDNPVISIDSDHDSIISVNESEVTDVGDICLNVSGGEIIDVENNKNTTKQVSNSLNVSKEEERALNLKMRFHTYWTADRETFYNRSWGGETYDHEEERDLMPASLKEWANPIDKMRMHRSFESKVRCRNCRQQGHIAKNCPVPVKPCSMCGSRQHREFKCNESCCLTVKPGKIIQPTQKNQKKSTNWCSICATRGHSSEKCCYYYNISQTPPDSMQVKHYSDLYDYNGASPKRRKYNAGEDNHWDIHQVKFSNQNSSFLANDQENSTKTTTTTSHILSEPEKMERIHLISITSTKSVTTETVSIATVPNASEYVQSITNTSNVTELNETKSVTTVPISPESVSLLPKCEVSVPESNKTVSNSVEQIATKPVAFESIPTAIGSGNICTSVSTELIQIKTKSSDIEEAVLNSVIPNPVITEPSVNLPIVTQSVIPIGASDPVPQMGTTQPVVSLPSLPQSVIPIRATEPVPQMETTQPVAPIKPVIVRTNLFETGSIELRPDIAISSIQSMKKTSNKNFNLDLPLNGREEQCVHRENFIKTLSKRFKASVYIKTKNSNRILHITASEQHRREIENCLKEFLTIKRPERRPSHNFDFFINKIRNDYPLIEEVYNLQDPYALYQTYTNQRIKKKNPVEIIKKLNAFRRIHCQQISVKTRRSLDFLHNIYNGQPVPINLRSKIKTAYNHIFKNTKIHELDEVINEFNQRRHIQQPPKISKQPTPKKSPTKKQKNKKQKPKPKPIQKPTVSSSTNDVELINYANMLEMATNIPKYRMIIKRCKHRYVINKEFSAKNIRSLMAVGEQLKIPFHT